MEEKNNSSLKKTSASKKKYFYAHGRRKEASARVRLYPGKGQTIINDKAIEDYFPSAVFKTELQKPFKITQTEGKYYATIKVEGSGPKGQLGAVIHGLSRALNIADEKHHQFLKKSGLLTRDPRVKERRKYGKAQKARKGKQSPKR